MDPPPPPAPPFEVIETERGRTYRLPPRPRGPARYLALLPLGFVGILGALLVKFALSRAALRGIGLGDDWFWPAFVALASGWAWMTYTGLDMAATLWCGHAEIEVDRDGAVRVYDRAGWFGFCLCWFRHGAVARLVLEECCSSREWKGGVWASTAAGLWQLGVQDRSGGKGLLAVGYPRPVLAALAGELARQLAVAPPDAAASGVAPRTPIPVVTDPTFPDRDTPEPPLNTRVALERHPDGVTLTVPRRGLAGKNAELFVLGLGLTALGGFVTVLVICTQRWPDVELLLGMYVGGMFLSIGGWLLITSLRAALAKVALAVVCDRLLTLETGPFGSTRREFARADVLDITGVTNNVPGNKKPLPELQIVAPDGTVVGMLRGRDEAELKWIATVLRRALGIPGEPPGRRRPPGAADKPWAAGRPRP